MKLFIAEQVKKKQLYKHIKEKYYVELNDR